MDYHLDDGSTGDDLIQTLRKRLSNTVPAIVISGDRDELLRSKLAAQGLPLLQKPLKTGRLRVLIADALEKFT